MASGGLKIVSEANLGRLPASNSMREEEKYKEVLVCLDHSLTPTTTPATIRHDNNSMEHILSDSTNIFRGASSMMSSGTSSSFQGNGGSSQQEQRTFFNLDSKSWQGGFATVVSPAEEIHREPPPVSPIFVSAETTPSAAVVRNRGGGRRPTIKVEEDLSPEEEERRRIRRERNKQAAARCRKRRMDQTTTLQVEVDEWEERKRQLQDEIHSLQTQREELQFILDAHRAVCTRPAAVRATTANRSLPVAAKTAPALPRVVVKVEPAVLGGDDYSSIGVSRNLAHEEALQCPPSTTVADSANLVAPVLTAAVSRRPQRPASLSFLAMKTPAVATTHSGSHSFLRYSVTAATSSIEGVPIETPTSVVNSLNFDALMDGRTGLTPTNILTPVSLSFSSSLNTPTSAMLTMMTATTPSGCSSQQRGQHFHHLGELMGSPDNGIMKLVSL